MADAMADPIARRAGSSADRRAGTCRVTWTQTGGVWIVTPDCSRESPYSLPPPNRAVWSRYIRTGCAINSVSKRADARTHSRHALNHCGATFFA